MKILVFGTCLVDNFFPEAGERIYELTQPLVPSMLLYLQRRPIRVITPWYP